MVPLHPLGPPVDVGLHVGLDVGKPGVGDRLDGRSSPGGSGVTAACLSRCVAIAAPGQEPVERALELRHVLAVLRELLVYPVEPLVDTALARVQLDPARGGHPPPNGPLLRPPSGREAVVEVEVDARDRPRRLVPEFPPPAPPVPDPVRRACSFLITALSPNWRMVPGCRRCRGRACPTGRRRRCERSVGRLGTGWCCVRGQAEKMSSRWSSSPGSSGERSVSSRPKVRVGTSHPLCRRWTWMVSATGSTTQYSVTPYLL